MFAINVLVMKLREFIRQDHRFVQFMIKLSEKFATVRGNILKQQPMPSLSNAFRIFFTVRKASRDFTDYNFNRVHSFYG